jgi:hypothetical protein
MSLHKDLLGQAERLARIDLTRPKQVSLRRAVSASYYAVFHLLTSEASVLYAVEPGLAARINRTFNHADMRKVSSMIVGHRLPRRLHPTAGTYTPPSDLKIVADAFITLQEARHEADYNPARTYRRSEALDFVDLARKSFAAWGRVRKTDDARLYLACFLLWDRWDKDPR